jgi:type 1 fimbriae regulatory protein FimB
MKYLTQNELRSLVAAAHASSARDWAMILVAYWHGLRASEVVSLTVNDVRDGFLSVQRLKGSRKTVQPLIAGNDPLFNEKAALAIMCEGKQASDRLFDINRRQFQNVFKKHGLTAGVPEHKCHPHAAKHSCAKIALQNGIHIDELQAYLGHKSLASTGAYLRSDDETASAAFARAAGV